MKEPRISIHKPIKKRPVASRQPRHDTANFYTESGFLTRRKSPESVTRNRQVTSRNVRCNAQRRIYAFMHTFAVSLRAGMQMRHARRSAPGSAASRNPFPTLVMAGIVNSIASELDAVGASRKEPVRRMQLKARTEAVKGSCAQRRCIRQTNALGSHGAHRAQRARQRGGRARARCCCAAAHKDPASK